ncbi:hypothetical protein B0A49_13810, partial [Cryomyces minteri]
RRQGSRPHWCGISERWYSEQRHCLCWLWHRHCHGHQRGRCVRHVYDVVQSRGCWTAGSGDERCAFRVRIGRACQHLPWRDSP